MDSKEEFLQLCNNIENAKPLEPEFAKILHDNLWDLYEFVDNESKDV
jgi:hypothetical protein